jgi:hypothetical protein
VSDWTYKRTNVGIVVMHGDGRAIATVHEEPYAPQLAATPELYDALAKIRCHFCGWHYGDVKALGVKICDNPWCLESRSALAKARGESAVQSPAPHQEPIAGTQGGQDNG